jgi:uncharacterized UPF0160 family protein
MKNILYFLMIVGLLSCKKDTMPYSSEFETSLKAWNNYKTSVNNSYSYSITSYSSGVITHYYETKIIVKNGIVTGRNYNHYIGSNTGQLLESYTEDNTTLNTHNIGAAAITL